MQGASVSTTRADQSLFTSGARPFRDHLDRHASLRAAMKMLMTSVSASITSTGSLYTAIDRRSDAIISQKAQALNGETCAQARA